MNQKIYVVCYNKQHIVNITVHVYDLDHETPTYLFLKEYGSVVRHKKNALLWFASMDDAKKEIQQIIAARITKLNAELERLAHFDEFNINKIPSETHPGPILV